MLALQDLSPEVIDLIATHSDPESLRTLRLISRRFYQQTFHCWAKRVANLRYLVSRDSLQTMLQVAEHDGVRDQIETLKLGTHFLDACGVRLDLEETILEAENLEAWDRVRQHQRRRDAFEQCFSEQLSFINNLGDQTMLAVALSHLQNLGAIEVGEWCEADRDPESC